MTHKLYDRHRHESSSIGINGARQVLGARADLSLVTSKRWNMESDRPRRADPTGP